MTQEEKIILKALRNAVNAFIANKNIEDFSTAIANITGAAKLKSDDMLVQTICFALQELSNHTETSSAQYNNDIISSKAFPLVVSLVKNEFGQNTLDNALEKLEPDSRTNVTEIMADLLNKLEITPKIQISQNNRSPLAMFGKFAVPNKTVRTVPANEEREVKKQKTDIR